MKRSPAARRTLVPRRAEVVDAVLAATFVELGEVGYGGLSIESVAARAGVNKTTVYRRWRTRVELVSAAFLSPRFLDALPRRFDGAGSLRESLIEYGRSCVRLADRVEWRAALRLNLMEGSHPELELIGERLKPFLDMGRNELVHRIKQTAEVPADRDVETLVEALEATLVSRSLTASHASRDADVERLVDVLFHGLVQKPRSPKRRHLRGVEP
jgi:AcrR family transcriptional regulator